MVLSAGSSLYQLHPVPPGDKFLPTKVSLVILLPTGCLPAFRPPPMAHYTPLFIPLTQLSESTISPLREGPGPHDSPLGVTIPLTNIY